MKRLKLAGILQLGELAVDRADIRHHELIPKYKISSLYHHYFII